MKNKNKTFVGVSGQLVNLKMQGSFNGGDDPYSQRAKSSRNKKTKLCGPPRPSWTTVSCTGTAAAFGLVGP